jgi:poly-gamma-glutamate capsule biosynthesis protein CapA/YwtB (metallophosphatase superfamily)
MRSERLLHFFKKMPRSTAVKSGGVALALLATFLPLFFWPSDGTGTGPYEKPQTIITVPQVVVVPSSLSSAETSTTLSSTNSGTTVEPSVEITIAAVGDIIIHQSVLESAYNAQKRQYDFRKMFAPVAPYLSAADYTVCSLESRLAGGTVSADAPLRFNAPYSLTDALTMAGVDLAATANNHSVDFGWLGIVRTLNRLDQAGIAHVGTSRSLKERETPLIVDIQGIKVAFLNYTEFVNGNESVKGREAYAVNMLNADQVAQEAAAARMQGADVVVAILHYGMEYRRTPTSAQTEISRGSAVAEGLLSRGVDVILGSHPHVVEPIVKAVPYSNSQGNDAYVAYSLGNFLTGQRWRYSDSGVIAYVHIQKQGLKTKVTGVSYLPVYVQKSSEEGVTYRILPVLPGLTPETDTVITPADATRMNQVWEELEKMLYRPDEGTVPLDPSGLGIPEGDREATGIGG